MIGHAPPSIGSFVTSPIRVGELTERALVNAGDLVIIGSGRFICHACLNRRNRIRDIKKYDNIGDAGTQSRDYNTTGFSFVPSFLHVAIKTRGKFNQSIPCQRSINIIFIEI